MPAPFGGFEKGAGAAALAVAAAPCEERDGREDVVAVPIGEHGRRSGRLCPCLLYYARAARSDLSEQLGAIDV